MAVTIMVNPFLNPWHFPLSQVLLDGNFIVAALRVKLDIKERLRRLLQGEEVVCCVAG